MYERKATIRTQGHGGEVSPGYNGRDGSSGGGSKGDDKSENVREERRQAFVMRTNAICGFIYQSQSVKFLLEFPRGR